MIEYSEYKYRLKVLKQGGELDWLFFPGGPGIGSEYLEDFASSLNIEGSKIIVDFPADGSNKQGRLDILDWEKGLLDLIKSFSNPIMVAHSFAGMFVLTIPELEDHLKGLVLINSATKNTFFEYTTKMREKHEIPDLNKAFKKYQVNPSNSSYKIFWDIYKYYCFTAEEMHLAKSIVDKFSFNHASYDYIEGAFYADYSSKWSPTKLPTMTIASGKDYILDSQIYVEDARYNRPNIMNNIIDNAGHFPWVKHLDKVQSCFDEYKSMLQ